MVEICLRGLSGRNREALLLRWYRKYQRKLNSEIVPMEDFDREYKRLFNEYPLWYYWSHFYRDHGLVGLRWKIYPSTILTIEGLPQHDLPSRLSL